jgi:diguanylate cyclase (GGDEF)-like protein/PAS domain S-box-containing protein
MPSMSTSWSHRDLIEWIGEDVVAFVDVEGKRLTVPDWVPPTVQRARSHSIGQLLAAAHPDDRQRMIDNWWEMSRHPGEEREIEIVVRGETGWSRELTRMVHLGNQEDIGAIVVAVRYIGTVDGVELPDMIQSGEYEDVNLLIHEMDESGIILRTEGKVFEISGHQPDEVIGESVLNHLHPDGFDDAIRSWLEVMTGPPGTTRTGRQRVLRPDGTTLWVESTTIKRVAEDGTVTATVICHDLTDRRKQESALRTSQTEFRLLADRVPGPVFRADDQLRLTFRNRRWIELVGDDDAVKFLHDVVHDDDRVAFDCEIGRLASGPSQLSATCEVRSREGNRVYEITCESVFDLVNGSRSFVGALVDITSTVRLRELAAHDPLTGLHNRASLEEHLSLALADHPNDTVVVFVDIDNFKAVNDTYGHEAGDRVLIGIAGRLRDAVRADDIVGRFGGDEFLLVLQDADVDDQVVIGRLATAVSRPVIWDGGSWQVSASIGVARPRPGEDVATVVRNADREMFAMKRRRHLRPA